jgi:hypothetical protein
MSTSKKTIKVRDLKPSKDAKGGGGHAVNSLHPAANSAGANSAGANSFGANSHKAQGHHGANN